MGLQYRLQLAACTLDACMLRSELERVQQYCKSGMQTFQNLSDSFKKLRDTSGSMHVDGAVRY